MDVNDIMRRHVHEMRTQIAVAIENRIQGLLDAGVPLGDIEVCWSQDARAWWLHVKTREEKWLNWLSENH